MELLGHGASAFGISAIFASTSLSPSAFFARQAVLTDQDAQDYCPEPPLKLNGFHRSFPNDSATLGV